MKFFTLLKKSLAILCVIALPVCATAPHLNIESLNIYSTSTNRNFKVKLNEQSVFFRIGRNDPSKVGINRESEIKFYMLAESLKIAPKLLGYEINNGLLITEYIEGASPSEEEIRQSSTMEKVIHNLHLLHGLQFNEANIKTSTVFSRNNELLENLKNLKLDVTLKEQIQTWQSAKNSFQTDYYQGIPLGICHGDLFRGNILQDWDGNLFFVDWEYSFYGYVIDDLGKFCSSNWLNDKETALASEMYWGVFNDQLFQKLHQNIFMQQFNFFLWCHIQAFDNPKESLFFYEMANRVGNHLNEMSGKLISK